MSFLTQVLNRINVNQEHVRTSLQGGDVFNESMYGLFLCMSHGDFCYVTRDDVMLDMAFTSGGDVVVKGKNVGRIRPDREKRFMKFIYYIGGSEIEYKLESIVNSSRAWFNAEMEVLLLLLKAGLLEDLEAEGSELRNLTSPLRVSVQPDAYKANRSLKIENSTMFGEFGGGYLYPDIPPLMALLDVETDLDALRATYERTRGMSIGLKIHNAGISGQSGIVNWIDHPKESDDLIRPILLTTLKFGAEKLSPDIYTAAAKALQQGAIRTATIFVSKEDSFTNYEPPSKNYVHPKARTLASSMMKTFYDAFGDLRVELQERELSKWSKRQRNIYAERGYRKPDKPKRKK